MIRRYSLQHGQPKRLSIHFKSDGTNLKVFLDEQEMLPQPLSRDDDFKLPDGSLLTVNWVDAGHGNFEIQPIVNAKVLPGSSLDPVTQINLAAVTTSVIAVGGLALGALRFSSYIPGVPTALDGLLILAGLLLGFLGFGIHKRIQLAVVIALGVASAEAVTIVFFLFPHVPRFQWLLLPFLPLPFIGQALHAIQELRDEAATSSDTAGIAPR